MRHPDEHPTDTPEEPQTDDGNRATVDHRRQFWHNNSLSIVLLALFLGSMLGQTLTGWQEYNEERRTHDTTPVTLSAYLRTGHFWEATGENWESEFLQMAMFVILTAALRQKGSAESKRLDVVEDVDLDPARFRHVPGVPGPVRRGGWRLRLYKHSLSLTFALLFVASFAIHGVGGWTAFTEDQAAHGQPPTTLPAYMQSTRFWFESLQNWQSEFLSLAAMVIGTIYLRQHGSSESKPVHASHSETGRA
jgi:hypothetical protein